MLTIAGNAAENPSPAKPGVEPSALPSAETQDEDFLRTAPGLLFPEIDASKLGAEKAEDPQLKAMSQRMVESYTKLARELEAAGRSAGLQVSNKQDPHAVHRLQRLQDTGPQFDLTFLAEQEGWHKKLVAIYSMEERAGRNEALKKHAEQGRALLIKNLEEIQSLQARLTDQRTTPGR
ncbi:MAG: DUF4142 domain-containing protein [Rhodospirillales bacterium]|nr:DUF4142 domain-containing protein [Rhodospirillales bacterium]